MAWRSGSGGRFTLSDLSARSVNFATAAITIARVALHRATLAWKLTLCPGSDPVFSILDGGSNQATFPLDLPAFPTTPPLAGPPSGPLRQLGATSNKGKLGGKYGHCSRGLASRRVAARRRQARAVQLSTTWSLAHSTGDAIGAELPLAAFLSVAGDQGPHFRAHEP